MSKKFDIENYGTHDDEFGLRKIIDMGLDEDFITVYEDNNFEDMSLEELKEYQVKIESVIEELYKTKPSKDDEDEHEKWEDLLLDMEDLLDEVEEYIEELEV